MEWTFKGANGRYGGLLIMWKKSLLYVCFSFVGEGFAECKIHFVDGMWCVDGDFNAINKEGERNEMSSSSNRSDRVEFNEFIEGMKLIDLPLMGKKFTWFN